MTASRKAFLFGFASGAATIILLFAAFWTWVIHYNNKHKLVTTDILTPLSEVHAPVFPDVDKPFVYGVADPKWSFHTLDGHEVMLGDFRRKVVFLHFWATWCGGCLEELDYINWLQNQTHGLPVAFVLVSGEDPKRVRKFLAAFRLALPAYVTTEKPPAALSFFEVPTTYIIAPGGAIAYRYVGAARWDDSSVKFLRDLSR